MNRKAILKAMRGKARPEFVVRVDGAEVGAVMLSESVVSGCWWFADAEEFEKEALPSSWPYDRQARADFLLREHRNDKVYHISSWSVLRPAESEEG